MKFIEKLNTTGKVLLLLVYIIVLSSMLLLVGSLKSGAEYYTDYGKVPGDENMDIAVRVKERRTLPSSANEKETQYWDLQVYLHLKDQKAIYRNVTIYTAILKKDGTYKYEEKSANVLTGIENPNNITGSTSDRGIYSSYSITSKTMVYNSSTEEYTKNNGEPDKIYVKVVYQIREEGKKEKQESFTYQCDVINVDEMDFDKFDSSDTNDSKNVKLNGIEEILGVKVRTELEEDTAKTDTYRLNVTYKPLKDEEKVIQNASLAVFLGMNNTESDEDKYFEDYIEFAQFHGSLPYLYTIPQIATAYSGGFEMDNLYVYAKVEDVDGQTQEAKVFIPVSSLPKY